ncbi:Transducin beta-like protein 3 [Ophiophagus hannah]|uniref:Transducin beta-like protein 3 n=1 Tax=Ophiophagus hannah TaxID=8665 RepID=V8NUH8_OPHHA|nr:Transducin beta-like protein 3 [Ophiophagus hannah]
MAVSSSSANLKSNYAVFRKIESFYTGGPIQVTQAGDYMFCACGSKVNIVDIETGDIVHSIEQDDETEITVFALSNDDEILVTGSQALLLKQWDWLGNKCTRTWKAVHTAPVASMTFDPSSTLLATGGCDSTIKIWDIPQQYCTHNLKGSSGVVHLVKFHPDISQPQLFSSSMDNSIRLWDLKSSQCVSQLDNHYSLVTSLSFCPDNETLISSGRDKICTVWDLKAKTTIESVVLLPQELDLSNLGVTKSSTYFLTAGSKGVLRVWDASSATCVHSQSLPHLSAESKVDVIGQHSLMHCSLVPVKSELVSVNVDRNICLYDAQTLELKKQFSGYNGEVLDVRFLGPKDSHIVVATNSSQLKVFELSSSNCQILPGHSDIVLALDVFRKGKLFASCSKDKTFRIWQMTEDGQVSCVAQGMGHTHQVGALACSKTKENFLITASQDRTMKVWLLPKFPTTNEKENQIMVLQARQTEVAHDKDVNSVAVSPNDKLVATGSQDKTAKLWNCENCVLLGVFSGHKRGIWCVQFSPVDQTFEGHDASVLKVIFVSEGGQVLSSGADGLLKLWTIKNNECVKTLDAHDNKVWALHANKKDDTVVTGSTDSKVLLWKDVTQTELEEEQAKQEEQILKDQELANLLYKKQFLKALGLALSLDRPHMVLTIIKAILKEPRGKDDLARNLMNLRKDQKEALLKFSITWNTNTRNCLEAQAVVEILLKHENPEDLLKTPLPEARTATPGLHVPGFHVAKHEAG